MHTRSQLLCAKTSSVTTQIFKAFRNFLLFIKMYCKLLSLHKTAGPIKNAIADQLPTTSHHKMCKRYKMAESIAAFYAILLYNSPENGLKTVRHMSSSCFKLYLGVCKIRLLANVSNYKKFLVSYIYDSNKSK